MAVVQHHNETRFLDETTLETLSYLESRVLRLEHILYGHTIPQAKTQALPSLQQLEHRFAQLLKRVRTYDELLKIYNAHPTLFASPSTSAIAPDELSTATLGQIVLASSTLYASTASVLTAIEDMAVPDPAMSAKLVALLPRMRVVEATQKGQAAEVAELRARSEQVIKGWYGRGVVDYGEFVADVEGRVGRVETSVRRAEKLRDDTV